jgi:hypothetical protein
MPADPPVIPGVLVDRHRSTTDRRARTLLVIRTICGAIAIPARSRDR